MTLKSGDRIFFDVATAHMTLQFMSKENLEKEVGECDDSRPETLDTIDGNDTVVLRGADVAKLLDAVQCGNESCVVVEKNRPGTSRLRLARHVSTTGDDTFTLEGDANTVTLTVAERNLLAAAIGSRVWRLFQ